MQEVKRMTNDKIKWREASIYPVLKMMSETGMIKYYWKVIENRRPRKYYTIMEEGQKQLDYAKDEVDIVYSLFNRLMNPNP